MGRKRKTLFESQIYHQVWSAYDYSNNKINRTQSEGTEKVNIFQISLDRG